MDVPELKAADDGSLVSFLERCWCGLTSALLSPWCPVGSDICSPVGHLPVLRPSHDLNHFPAATDQALPPSKIRLLRLTLEAHPCIPLCSANRAFGGVHAAVSMCSHLLCLHALHALRLIHAHVCWLADHITSFQTPPAGGEHHSLLVTLSSSAAPAFPAHL